MKARLEAGDFEDRKVELNIEQRRRAGANPRRRGVGLEQMESDLQGMFERILPKSQQKREVTIREGAEF